jgi:hypothetical protein
MTTQPLAYSQLLSLAHEMQGDLVAAAKRDMATREKLESQIAQLTTPLVRKDVIDDMQMRPRLARSSPLWRDCGLESLSTLMNCWVSYSIYERALAWLYDADVSLSSRLTLFVEHSPGASRSLARIGFFVCFRGYLRVDGLGRIMCAHRLSSEVNRGERIIRPRFETRNLIEKVSLGLVGCKTLSTFAS